MPYLVDGHNLLAQIPGLRLDDPGHRQRLVRMLTDFSRARRCRVIVLFDGVPPAGWREEIHLGSVRVLHSGPGRSADDVILDRVRRAAAPGDITVVSSDRPLGDRARHLGARRIPVGEFRALMARARGDAGGAGEKPDRPDPDEIDYFLEAFGESPSGSESRSRSRR